MGLVIIVILVVFIAIFSLSFMIKPKQENEDILKLKVNALRSSLLKTNLCEGVNVKEELESCIDDYSLCSVNCDYLEGEIVKIIESSLENENYYFKFNDIELGNCVEKVTAVGQIIGEEDVELALCRR